MLDRTRSPWAWGYEDQFLDEESQTILASFAQNLLGVSTLHRRQPLSFRDELVPAARVAVPASLQDFAVTSARERALHTYGKSLPEQLRALSGDFRSAPDAVLYPRSEEEVALALSVCEANRIAVIPFGGGTSVVGGVEPIVPPRFVGAVSLDLCRLNRLLEVDAISRRARLQAGIKGPELEDALREHGLTLRHYPQSFEFSTLGGWLATRAGGHYATLYTHIDDLTESLRMVTPRGVIESRTVPASGAGPTAERLLLGSEGALGVITEAWLRVQKRPRFRASAAVAFAELDTAVTAARTVTQAMLHPSNCRLLDEREAMLAGAGQRPTLLLGFESAERSVEAAIHEALTLCRGLGGECSDGPVVRDSGERGGSAQSEAWRKAFFAGPYRQSALLLQGVLADTFETACTWTAFPTLHAGVTAAVTSAMKNVAGAGAMTLRFTHVYPDGPAPYYTFMMPWPATAADSVADATRLALSAWREAKQAASEAILAAGGTITHHHAVGKVHLPWLEKERSPLFGKALAAVKRELDPAWMLNPGVLLPDSGAER